MIAEIWEWLDGITYRPGVRFTFTNLVDPHNSLHKDTLQVKLDIWEMVPDSTMPNLEIEKHYVTTIRVGALTESAVGYIKEEVFRHFEEFEKHETAEWFRVNGKRHKEPH